MLLRIATTPKMVHSFTTLHIQAQHHAVQCSAVSVKETHLMMDQVYMDMMYICTPEELRDSQSIFINWTFIEIWQLLFTFLITPAPIELGSSGLAPSIFIFLYDLVLENTFSFRSLRPLALSLFGVIILFFIIKTIRRRFF